MRISILLKLTHLDFQSNLPWNYRGIPTTFTLPPWNFPLISSTGGLQFFLEKLILSEILHYSKFLSPNWWKTHPKAQKLFEKLKKHTPRDSAKGQVCKISVISNQSTGCTQSFSLILGRKSACSKIPKWTKFQNNLIKSPDCQFSDTQTLSYYKTIYFRMSRLTHHDTMQDTQEDI